MGDGMPGNVARGAAFDQLDRRMNDKIGRQQIMLNLRANADMVEGMQDAAGQTFAFDAGQQAHVKTHWLSGEWFGTDPVQTTQILRAILLLALDEAQARETQWRNKPKDERKHWLATRLAIHEAQEAPLLEDLANRDRWVPIRTYWVCSGGEYDDADPRFSAGVLSSEDQVTLLFFTPYAEAAEAATRKLVLNDPEDVWLVGARDHLSEALSEIILSGGPAEILDMRDGVPGNGADGPEHRRATALRYLKNDGSRYEVIAVRAHAAKARMG